jgi:hypothetical protein
MNREPIYAALFSLLQSAYAWNTASRVLSHWSDVDRVQQPAMFMTQVGEQAIVSTREPTKWLLNVRVFIYAHSQTFDGDIPGQILNTLLDAITTKMKPAVAAIDTQTLGGLVHYARIEGNIETDEGYLGEQALAIIPITMLVAD